MLHDWLAALNWGDVATWVQGIATVGTLWLGLTILRSDRKKAERAQAAQITVWRDTDETWKQSPEYDSSQTHWVLNVWNTSTQPVTRPFIRFVPYTRREFEKTENSHMDYDRLVKMTPFLISAEFEDARLSLDPGQRVHMVVSVQEVLVKKVLLQFNDAAGTQWTKDMSTSTLWKYRDVELPAWADFIMFLIIVASYPIRKRLPSHRES
jgi:hypothetical protein